MTRAGLADDELAELRENKGDDSVVKLRPVVPANLPGKLRRSSSFGVEVDAMPGGYVSSGSFRHTLAAGDVKDTMAGRRPLRKLFSKGQQAFFADHVPDHVELDDLAVLGPIFVLKRAYLAERGIDLSGEQQTKTRRALEFFSARLEK